MILHSICVRYNEGMKMGKRIVFLLICIGVFLAGNAQDFRVIDSTMRLQKATSIEQLVQVIKANYYSPTQQVRAAYAWMIYHIDYDVPGFFNPKLYDAQWPATVQDSADRENLFREQVAKRVFKERKGVCEGYSKLFLTLCKKLGIEARPVVGFGKTEIRKSDSKFNTNHEWDLVKIDGTWHPVDVTWAAGFTDFGKKKFNREINHHYFFTDPGLLLVDHYPAKKTDALLAWVPSFGQFISRPMVYRDFWLLNPQNFNASNGIYKFSDSAFTMVFKSTTPIERVQIIGSNSQRQEAYHPIAGETEYIGSNFVSYAKDGTLKIRYRPAKQGDRKVIVFINGRAVMEFLVE